MIAIPAVVLLVEAVAARAVAQVVAALARLTPVLAPVLAEIRAFAAALTATASGWTVVTSGDAADGLVKLRLVPPGPLAADVLLVGMQIGFLRIDDVPVDATKHIGAAINGGFALVDYRFAAFCFFHRRR